MKGSLGFTLIELLLVLAVIGIIAAIAIPALLGQRARAKAKAVHSLVANASGECARISDTLKEASTSGATAANVVTSFLALSNYRYPATRNPYGGTLAPYHAAAAPSARGRVSLQAVASYRDEATGRSYAAVILRGRFLDPNSNADSTAVKVVALD